MPELTFDGAGNALYGLSLLLTSTGEHVAPRGLATREVLDVTTTLTNPYDATLYGCDRAGYHPAIGVIEGLLMIAGVSDPPLLRSANAVFAKFQDGGALHGAYGPRLRTQLPFVVDRLKRDPDTRQAVATIWDPLYDLYDGPRDLPCTVDLVFRIRDGKLTLKTHMRSNDLWRGWCYDVLQFTLLQCTVANVLQVPVGPYVHLADSMHVYDENVEALTKVSQQNGRHWRPRLFGLAPTITGGGTKERWESVRVRALHLLYDQDPRFTLNSETEVWLRERVDAVRTKEGR